jgi:hypothetical protein
MARRRITDTRATRGTTRPTRATRTPRAMPDDNEMSVRASRIGRGRQSAGAGRGQGLAGSAIYSLQDMLNHPAVEWSRGMARGPAQGKVDEVTADVHNRLAEVGIFRDDTGTWQIDMAKNAASRQKSPGITPAPTQGLPGGTLPRQGGFPGPAKPPDPRSFPQPTGKPPAPAPAPSPRAPGPPVGGGTLPRQGPIYTPETPKPPAPTGLPPGTLPRQLPVIPSPQETAKPPQPTGGTLPRQSSDPGMNEVWGRATQGGSLPRQVPPVQMDAPPPGAMNFSGQGYVTPGAGPVNAQPMPKPPAPQGGTLPRQLPQQQVSGQYPNASQDPNIRNIGYSESRENYAAYLRSMGYDERGNPLPKPAGPNPGQAKPPDPSSFPQPQGKPPGPNPGGQPPAPPRPGYPSPTGRPQGVPPTFGQNTPVFGGDPSQLGGQIRSQVDAMLGGMNQRMNSRMQQQQPGGGIAGLAGLGDRIQQSVQSRVSGNGNPAFGGGDPGGNPGAGLQGLGQRIQQSVQSRIGGMGNPAFPNVPRPGGQGMPSPGGMPGPGGGSMPAPGREVVPAPAPPGGGGNIPAPSGGTLGAPTGQIPVGNITGGGSWDSVNQYDAQLSAAAAKHGVDPAMLKAMMIIESGGDPGAAGAGGAIGLMQVKPEYWQAEAQSLGYDLYTPEGQIGMAAAILGGDVGATRGMSPEEAFVSVYYPTPCLDCPGESGHTPRMYLDDMRMYMDIINAAGGQPTVTELPTTGTGGTLPRQPGGEVAKAPAPVPGGNVPTGGGDIVSTTVGGTVSGADINYGLNAPATPAANANGECWYCYYEGHGGDRWSHPGVDIPGGYGDAIYSPIQGTVTCAGTGNGPGSWDTGCAAFGDNNGGTGRLEVYDDRNGVSYIFGHSSSSAIQPGQTVNVGDYLGGIGWSDPHVHLEARVWCDSMGTYLIVDPQAAMQSQNGSADFCPR